MAGTGSGEGTDDQREQREQQQQRRRLAFQAWLRGALRERGYYQSRYDRYLVNQFWQDATEQRGARLDINALWNYFRANPPLPSPDTCRELARGLACSPAETLIRAGYLTLDDLYVAPAPDATVEQVRVARAEVARSVLIPAGLRVLLLDALDRRLVALGAQVVVDDETGDTGDTGATSGNEGGNA